MVAVAMTCSVANRTPPSTSGTAEGTSTCRRIWDSRIPIPRAASTAPGSAPATPE